MPKYAAVGLVVAVVGLMAGLFYYYSQKRQQQQQEEAAVATQKHQLQPQQSPPVPLDGCYDAVQRPVPPHHRSDVQSGVVFWDTDEAPAGCSVDTAMWNAVWNDRKDPARPHNTTFRAVCTRGNAVTIGMRGCGDDQPQWHPPKNGSITNSASSGRAQRYLVRGPGDAGALTPDSWRTWRPVQDANIPAGCVLSASDFVPLFNTLPGAPSKKDGWYPICLVDGVPTLGDTGTACTEKGGVESAADRVPVPILSCVPYARQFDPSATGDIVYGALTDAPDGCLLVGQQPTWNRTATKSGGPNANAVPVCVDMRTRKGVRC